MNQQTNNTDTTASVSSTCPGCGSRLPGSNTAVCPYCGMELIDLSREYTDIRIEEVKKAHVKTGSVLKMASLVVTITFFILFLTVTIAAPFYLPDKMLDFAENALTDRLSSAMEKAYEKKDWEKLEKYVIDESGKYMAAPDYFQYRTAWLLHTCPPLFDDARTSRNTDKMLDIYKIIASDYNMRKDDSFYRFYDTDESIEESLQEEFERETEILTEEGLEDEMYKLRF